MQISSILVDLAAICLGGTTLGLLARVIHLPVIVGYIFAGYLLGPYSPIGLSLVRETKEISAFAELGIILLIFSIGLEMGFKKLKAVGFSPFFIGIGECSFVWLCLTAIARSFGYSPLVSQFIGAMFVVSSTVVVVNILKSKQLTHTKFAEKVIAILLVEDVFAIFLLMYLSTIFVSTNVAEYWKVGLNLLITIFTWWFGGSIVVPRLINVAHKKGGNELLLFSSLGLCLGLALFASALGFSTALGAFLMGAILADTRQNRLIEHLITPIQQIFGVIFFVSFGMFFNPILVWSHLGLFFALLAAFLTTKIFFPILLSMLIGINIKDSLKIGFSIAQIGEFAFIIASIAANSNIIPQEIFPLIVGASILTISISPLLMNTVVGKSHEFLLLLPSSFLNFHKLYSDTVNSIFINKFSFRFLNIKIFNRLFRTFSRKFMENYKLLTSGTTSSTLDRLAPWDEYLSEVILHESSSIVGKSLIELDARMLYHVNIVAIERNSSTFISPDPTLRLFPGDALLIYGTEKDIATFVEICITKTAKSLKNADASLKDCILHSFVLSKEHFFTNQCLKTLQLREKYNCTVLAVVRDAEKIKNPPADFIFLPSDELFLVGPRSSFEKI